MAKLSMAKLLGCRICMVDFARIELADGSVALLCSACDVTKKRPARAARR